MKPIEEDTPSLGGFILILIIVFFGIFGAEELKADNECDCHCDNLIINITLPDSSTLLLNQTCVNCTDRGCVEWSEVK